MNRVVKIPQYNISPEIQPIPVYFSLFLHFQTSVAYSILFKHIVAYINLFQPSPTYQLILAYFSIYQAIPPYISI